MVAITVFFVSTTTYSENLDDIRQKTGWQPRIHSERKDAYCPLITPAELLADLHEYYFNNIKMQVLFSKITTTHLNKWIGNKSKRRLWSNKRFIAFGIEDPNKQIRNKDINLFLAKTNPCKELLLGLKPDDKITITGFVRDDYRNRAWIEVYDIKNGWVE